MIRSKARLRKRISASAVVAALVGAAIAVGQGTPIPVKLGLWETTVSTSNEMSLPPEAEARIAALPPDQQAMIRSKMGGAAPVVQTRKSCVASQTTMDALLNPSQDRPGAKCAFSNRTQTSSGASFDMSCTTPQGSVTGHSEFHMSDSDHLSGTTHMSGTMTGRNGGTTTMKMTSTMTSKYLGADCGDVKPFTPPPAQ